MFTKQQTITNLIQTLARAVELSELAHDYGPEHLTIALHRNYDEGHASLRIECDGTAVEFNPDHQRLANVFGSLEIKERTDAV